MFTFLLVFLVNNNIFLFFLKKGQHMWTFILYCTEMFSLNIAKYDVTDGGSLEASRVL